MLLAAAAPAAPPETPHTGGLLTLIDGTGGLLTVAALGIALLLFLIIKVSLQPFVALLAVSIAVGLSAGLSVTELFGTVQKSDAVSMHRVGHGRHPRPCRDHHRPRHDARRDPRSQRRRRGVGLPPARTSSARSAPRSRWA